MKLQITIDGTLYEADIEVLEEDGDAPVATRVSGGAPRAAAPRLAPRAAAPAASNAPSAPPPPKAPAPAGAVDENKVVRSSIVGIVVKILAKPGQAVHAGESVLVLEAMKMESNVNTALSGKVKAVCVAPGESVKKGQILIEFE